MGIPFVCHGRRISFCDQETLSLGDENKHLKLQNAHAQQTIEQLTTEGQNVKDELTNSILKIRQAAAEEQGLLQQRITKLHAELKKAAKVLRSAFDAGQGRRQDPQPFV